MENKTEVKQTCALCGSPADQESAFCCSGCRMVHQILSVRGEIGDFRQSDVYQEALRAGLISSPHLLSEQEEPQEGSELLIALHHLWCPSCARIIEWILCRKGGVLHCRVDYATDFGKVVYDPQKISPETVLDAIRRLGYGVDRLEDAFEEQKPPLQDRMSPWLAAFCTLNVMMFSFPLYLGQRFPTSSLQFYLWTAAAFSLPVIFWCGLPLFRRSAWSFRSGIWGMEALVTLSVLSAWGFSIYSLLRGRTEVFFDSSSALLTFTLFGNLLEQRAKRSAKQTIAAIAYAMPRKGRKQVHHGEYRFVPLKELEVGDRLLVSVGERVPVDGVVVEGVGSCDESTWTGEALPILKREGDAVLGGSLVKQGPLVIEMTNPTEKMNLRQIAQVIAGDLDQKNDEKRLVDRIVETVFPGLLLLATVLLIVTTLSSGFEEAIRRALTLLFIACPCALAIAAPFAEARWIDSLAQKGILIRNRRVLSRLGKETVMVFDKTGTITEGEISEVGGLNSIPLAERQALKSMVSSSDHPIARALCKTISEPTIPLSHVEEQVGRGIKARQGKTTLRVGSDLFLQEEGIRLSGSRGDVWFAVGKDQLYPIDLMDPLRTNIEQTVALFSVETILLSGDHPENVEKLARQCHFTDWRARYSPLEKRAYILEKKRGGECVSMVGDGVNDAAALAAADVSWAVGGAADVTQQVADVLLGKNGIEQIHLVQEGAKHLRKIVRQNLAWAFVYNVLGMALAMRGLLNPLFAACAMFLSSLAILLNTRRIG